MIAEIIDLLSLLVKYILTNIISFFGQFCWILQETSNVKNVTVPNFKRILSIIAGYFGDLI